MNSDIIAKILLVVMAIGLIGPKFGFMEGLFDVVLFNIQGFTIGILLGLFSIWILWWLQNPYRGL